MQKTILVIEDDADIRNIVTDNLQHAGYQTLTAETAMNGMITARQEHPHLILLDLGLPDFDGSEVARRLRSNHNDIPIIILTAMDEVDRKLHLLEVGANDYITKPFYPDELLARIKVQFRHQDGPGVIKHGPLEVNPRDRLIQWNGQEVALSSKETDVLMALAKQPGRILSRAELIREVWNDQLPEHSNTLEVHLANLRGKFRKVGAYRVVRTVRGVGYGLYLDS